MQFTISPTEAEVFEVIRTFLLSVLPQTSKRIVPVTLSDGEHPVQTVDMEVFRFNENRVPEPTVLDYIILTPVRKERISTNIDIVVDVKFTASIVADVMTVTAVDIGDIVEGSELFGTDILVATRITNFISGVGGIGTYRLNKAQTLTERTMAAGEVIIMDPVQLALQLDIHGPQSTDISYMLGALFRDEYAYTQIQALNPAITPLFEEPAVQAPFINDQKQYEYRWVLPIALEINGTVRIPQQFADTLDIGIISVDAVYPPT